MANKFWAWAQKNNSSERTLYLEGVIAEESWFEDDVTPAAFKADLFADSGPITLHINSPGGDCIAASQIYTMLMDYPHDVKVQIDGIAASAAFSDIGPSVSKRSCATSGASFATSSSTGAV